jgi:DNA-binding CsgD family transcriptional regulator
LSPVTDQVAFRLDFSAWVLTLSARNRDIVEQTMLGERAQRIADRFGLAEGRVSQLRGEFRRE